MSRWCDQSINDTRTSDTRNGPHQVAFLFGARAAETILASVHVRTHRQAGHMDASDLIKALQNTLRGGGRPHMRVLATRSGRLDQPPANDARGLDPRDRLLRPVQRAEHRLLDQLTAAVIAGRYGLRAHDPFG